MGLRAIMVAVDYADLLSVVLPYNAHHFDEVWVVTDEASYAGVVRIASVVGPKVFVVKTDLFYRGGAELNKWAALEWGLGTMGRDGWLCVMDADVLWPRAMVVSVSGDGRHLFFTGRGRSWEWSMTVGNLACPRRRMYPKVPTAAPDEATWPRYAVHAQEAELAGYSQLFHASDPVLSACADCGHAARHHRRRGADTAQGCAVCPCPTATWHQTNWRHAGGADSFFQALWPRERKLRPPFEVLHLGPAGHNWCGRAVAYADGTSPPGAGDRLTRVRQYVTGRLRQPPGGRFDHEKIHPAQ